MKTKKNSLTLIAVAAFAAFLATFNETFLNVAFSPIMHGLNINVSAVQWLATAYMLGAALMIPISAFAYRSIPTRILFLAAAGLLVCGSIIGGLAESFPILLTGRIVQALGTGLLIPIGMNITLEVSPKEKLGTYMGIMGAMTTLGPSSSVIIAGLLLSRFGWHTLLWVFGGLSLVCFLSGLLLPKSLAKLTKPKLDAPSVAMICLSLVFILYAVSSAFTLDLWICAGFAVCGAVLLAVFVRRQKKLEYPLISMRPLSVTPFRFGMIANMLVLIVIFAMNIIIPVFLQSVLGISPLKASLTLFPAIMLSCILSPIAGKIYDKHGLGLIMPLGFGLVCLFAAALSYFITGGSIIFLALLYIPVIGGSALIIGPVQSFALAHLPKELYPHGVTLLSTGFQIAGCIGSSLFSGVYAGVTTFRMSGGISATVAASTGFLSAGLLAALCAAIGMVVAIKVSRINPSNIQ